ncbi:hypothetical protein [Pyrolobus fumarii]|nr:hypothetical protein [Pyrolobus fumarii]
MERAVEIAGAVRAASLTLAVIVLVLIAVVTGVFVYIYTTGASSETGASAGKAVVVMRSAATVEAVKVGAGYLELYVRGLQGEHKIDVIYVYNEHGDLLAAIGVNPPIKLEPGEVKRIVIPLVMLHGELFQTSKIRIVLATSSGVGIATGVVDAVTLRKVKPIVIGLVAGRAGECTIGNLWTDSNYIHWVYVDLIKGEYKLRYIDGSYTVDAQGRATILVNVSVLDLSRLFWTERYNLGPVVVFINPYSASKDYTVRVIDIYGNEYVFDMKALVQDSQEVVIDALILWEDLWWPGTGESLDNYVDHVVRFTVFTNGTARIEVVRASGCYLHMFMFSSSLPDFNSVPRIVDEYVANDYMLPPEYGVVYVKSHAAVVPDDILKHAIWDPVRGVWVKDWPPVFHVHILQ